MVSLRPAHSSPNSACPETLPKWQPCAGRPVALHRVAHTPSNLFFEVFGVSHQIRATPPSCRGVAPPLPQWPWVSQVKLPLSKGVALHRGVAATQPRVALHFAT